MDTRENAPLTPKGREAMVRYVIEAGQSKAAARQFNTTSKTVAKWVVRFHAEGVEPRFDLIETEKALRAGSVCR
jgi:transposase-like protein